MGAVVDKEWTRVVQTVHGFGKKHGHWPTRLVLPESTHESLSQAFSKDDWTFLAKEVQLRTGAERPRAEDDEGDSYIWGESLATRLTFTVDAPEPTWLKLSVLPGDPEQAPDELTRALKRLGYEQEGADPTTAIERAVARAGSAAIKRLTETDPPALPGVASAELRALLGVNKVRDVMSARSFRRIQNAVLRVYAAEFTQYFGFRSREDEDAWALPSQWATELGEALKEKPLSNERLHELESAILAGEVGRPTLTEFSKLVAWVAALALDERRLSHDDLSDADLEVDAPSAPKTPVTPSAS